MTIPFGRFSLIAVILAVFSTVSATPHNHIMRINAARDTSRVESIPALHFPILPFFQKTIHPAIGLPLAQQRLNQQGTVFIENKGQWDRQVRFLMRCSGMDTWITDHGVRYDLFNLTPVADSMNEHEHLSELGQHEPPAMIRSGHVVGITFEGASFAPRARGVDQQPGAHNYFLGNNQSKWASGVRLFAGAQLDELYEGIDAVFYLDEGRPRYDLIVDPGADPGQVQMKIEGSNGVSVGADGSLLIETSVGTLQQRELYAFQEIGGVRRQVACRFVVGKDQRVNFDMGNYDRSRALVIDPLVYSTYLGGGLNDNGASIAVDDNGDIYVVGATESVNYPRLQQYQNDQKDWDVFMTKLSHGGNSTFSLAYSTYLGGDAYDGAYDIAVDRDGNSYVTGNTKSQNFPTVHEWQKWQISEDAFVTKLVHHGNGNVMLEYSTHLASRGADVARGIAIDAEGNAYIVGHTTNSDFPVRNEFQKDQPLGDAFVARFSYDGGDSVRLDFSTYLGGDGDDFGFGIAIDRNGYIYVTGKTASKDFPTLHEYQQHQGAVDDAFVSKLRFDSNDSLSLVYSTYLGGRLRDQGNKIAVDASENVYIAGNTQSTDFPTIHEFQSQLVDLYDGFVTKLIGGDSGNIRLAYSTYLGGDGDDFATGIAVNKFGSAYIIGITQSSNFPLKDPYQTNEVRQHVFLSKLIRLDSGNVQLAYSTYFRGGGEGFEGGLGIAVDRNGHAYLTGYANSSDLPTLNPFQSHQGNNDAFVAKFEFEPELDVPMETSRSPQVHVILALMPNPANTEMVISFTIPETLPVSLDIYSNDGSLVLSPLRAQSREGGNHTEVIAVDALPPGGYTLRLVAGNDSFVERFVVVR